MPNEENVAGSPDQQQQQGPATQSQQPSGNNGNRADTSRDGQPQQQAQQPSQGFTYKEKRDDWIPPHRLGEVSGRLTKAEERAQQLQAQLEDRDRKLRLAMGVEQQDPNEQEDEKARQVLRRLFPVLDKLNDETLQQVLQTAQAGEAIQQTNDAYWNRHADQMLGDVKTEFAKSLGQETLTESQTKRIAMAYLQEAESCQAARVKAAKEQERTGYTNYDFENDFLSRHNKGDKSLISEFVKGFTSDFFEPARRQVTRNTGGRFAVPNGRGRGAVHSRQEKPKLGTEKEFKSALNDAIERYS